MSKNHIKAIMNSVTRERTSSAVRPVNDAISLAISEAFGNPEPYVPPRRNRSVSSRDKDRVSFKAQNADTFMTEANLGVAESDIVASDKTYEDLMKEVDDMIESMKRGKTDYSSLQKRIERCGEGIEAQSNTAAQIQKNIHDIDELSKKLAHKIKKDYEEYDLTREETSTETETAMVPL